MNKYIAALFKSVCIAVLCLGSIAAYAQSEVISGTVKDGNGMPVVGATVLIQGTTTGTNTNFDGFYTISVQKGQILEITCIGYKSTTVEVGNSAILNVVLQEDTLYLDDVVVVGYGTQSRGTITSSVSKLEGDVLASSPVNSIGDALKGRIGGVRVSSSNNEPGSDPVFMIRGGSSINQSNAPIVLVDGLERSISGLNPNDIESIEVLKDAASAGIYGARASNGVVLVTTKKGNAHQRPQVVFEAQGAWTSPATRFDTMNAREYLTTMRKMFAEYPSTYAYGSGLLSGANSAGVGNSSTSIWTPYYVDSPDQVPDGWQVMVDPVDSSKLIAFQDNDQQSQWFSDSYWMNYYVGVNGGSDRVTYSASVGYTEDGGIGINTDYNRFTFHGNTTFKILDNLKATATFDYNQNKGHKLPSSGIANYWTTVGRGFAMPNTHRDYLEDGTPAQGTNSTTMSAVWYDTYYHVSYENYRTTAHLDLEWEIIPGLKAVASVANSAYHSVNDQRLDGNAISTLRQTYEAWSQTNRFNTQEYLSYDKTFKGKHNFDAMAGFEYTYAMVNGMSLTTTGADSDKVPTLAAGTDATAWTDTNTGQKLASFFGRIGYNYDKKYIAMFTFRADASSLFAAGNRWGFFPAGSIGWVVSKEDFWDVNNFNNLKFRLSYGLTGNNGIGYYDAYGAYTATGIYDGSSAIIASTLPNLGLTWEKTRQLDFGVDMGWLDDRIRLSADAYGKVTTNLLFDVTLPDTSGYSSATQNIGSVLFYGAEIEISSVNISKKNFSWTTDFTYSFNMNRVLSLPDEYYYVDLNGNDAWRIGGYTLSESGYRFGGTAVGERLGRIYGYHTAYIIETQAQADAALYDTNSHGVRRSDGMSIAGRKDIGDYEWMNREGSALTSDGQEQIDSEDMYLLGYVTPHSTGGMNNTFRLGNWSLSIYVDYALGHSIYNYMYTRFFQTSMGNCNWNLVKAAGNTWQQPGDKTIYAKLSPNDSDGGNKNYSRASNINVQKGDYLCLRDVTLSYSFPKEWISRAKISDVTLSVSGNTLAYLTAVKGISPESGVATSGSGSGMYSSVNTGGSDYSVYPPTRKVMFTVKVTF